MRSALLSLGMILMTVLGTSGLAGAQGGPEKAPPKLGDYNREPREVAARSDGHKHVDTPLLIQQVKALGASVYAFLIWHSPTDWDDLRLEFLPAAQEAGLEVWVYLVPPSEQGPDYVPFRHDYVRWAKEVAALSLQYPCLTAFVMDDFDYNVRVFTPSYTREMLNAARAVNPGLEFYAISYYDGFEHTFIAADYSGAVDGVIFPYTDLDSAEALPGQIAHMARVLRDHPLVLSQSFPAKKPSEAGWYCSLSQRVEVSPEGSHTIRLRVRDDYPGETAGYHFKQILVDGQVAWEEDVAGRESAGERSLSLDLAPYLKGKTAATIAFCLYDKQGVSDFPVRVWWQVEKAEGIALRMKPEAWVTEIVGQGFQGSAALLPYQMKFFLMPYCAPTTWHTAPPTTEYIGQVVKAGMEAYEKGLIDGIVTYCLIKEPDHPDYLAVQHLYTHWAGH